MSAILTALGTLAPIIAGGLGIASQAMTNKSNREAQDEANQLTRENLQWQKDQYFDQKAYNEQLQEKMFQREDTSYQRTKDDLIAAGYSPLAINGTNQAGSVVSQPSIPELQTINPFQQTALNFGQLADIISNAERNDLERRKVNIEEQKNLTESEQKKNELEEQKREFQEQMKQNQNQFDQNYNLAQQQLELQKNQFTQQQKKEYEEIQIKKQELEKLTKQLELQESKQQAEIIQQTLNQLTGGRGRTHRYTNYDEYQTAYNDWCIKWANQKKKDSNKLLMNPSSTSKNGQGTVNILGNGVNGSYGISETFELLQSVNDSDIEFLMKNPVPVYY